MASLATLSDRCQRQTRLTLRLTFETCTIPNVAPFADLALSKRLERSEGHACAQFAAARRRLFPGSGSEWMECSGAYAVFDGIGSPLTQTFGLGLFEELTTATLDEIERFFLERG